MATVGEILDSFFSPLSRERLWVMPETDNYTQIARRWEPVISAVSRIKAHAAANCTQWSVNYMTDAAWAPTMSDVPKPNSHREFVAYPPGTDPETCKKAFVQYVTAVLAKAGASAVSPLAFFIPTYQPTNLYTCSIGSFSIYTTADQIDCAARRARLNFWMYNNMSRHSFRKFASEPVFSACGMRSQYMWWNWVESITWSAGVVVTAPHQTDYSAW